MSIGSCVEQVLSLVTRPEFQETPASRKKLAGLAVEAKARAALKADVRSADIDITALNAAIEPGRVTVIAGPNGAGKTTLLQAILGLNEPASLV